VPLGRVLASAGARPFCVSVHEGAECPANNRPSDQGKCRSVVSVSLLIIHKGFYRDSAPSLTSYTSTQPGALTAEIPVIPLPRGGIRLPSYMLRGELIPRT